MPQASRLLSESVAGYQEACEMWARKYVGWNRAELDDLVQEGMIAVWTSLEAGAHPSQQVVQGRMHNWVRTLGRQMGQGDSAEAYEEWFSDEYQE